MLSRHSGQGTDGQLRENCDKKKLCETHMPGPFLGWHTVVQSISKLSTTQRQVISNALESIPEQLKHNKGN